MDAKVGATFSSTKPGPIFFKKNWKKPLLNKINGNEKSQT
jgi:hypothetical protein